MNPSRPSSQGPPLSARLLASKPGTSDSYATLEGPPGQQSPIFRNVEAGRYSVELMPQDPWYVQSAEYGQINLLTDDLILTNEAPPLTMEVVLRNDVASLAGTVHCARWRYLSCDRRGRSGTPLQSLTADRL